MRSRLQRPGLGHFSLRTLRSFSHFQIGTFQKWQEFSNNFFSEQWHFIDLEFMVLALIIYNTDSIVVCCSLCRYSLTKISLPYTHMYKPRCNSCCSVVCISNVTNNDAHASRGLFFLKSFTRAAIQNVCRHLRWQENQIKRAVQRGIAYQKSDGML